MMEGKQDCCRWCGLPPAKRMDVWNARFLAMFQARSRGWTLEEIGRCFGVTRQNVQQVLKRGLVPSPKRRPTKKTREKGGVTEDDIRRAKERIKIRRQEKLAS